MKQQAILLAVAALVGTNAYAGGLEKNVMWSGKYVGVGGAATSWVSGSESLYYNPAGLGVKTGEHGDISLNFSPTFSKFKGPITSTTGELDSKTSFSPIGGAFASYHPMDKLGVAVGYFVSGGTRAKFEDVTVGTINPKPVIRSEITLTELSIGAGYEVIPGLRVGAAWRILHVSGDLDLLAPLGGGAAYFRNDDISKSRYDGFRVGAQYEPEGKLWGVGVNFRNNVNFTADDTQTVINPATNATVSSGAGSLHAALPWQVSVGGNYKFANEWRGHLEYSFTDYSKVRKIDIAGPQTSVLPVAWRDQSNYRVGLEYSGLEALTLRAGYVLTTNVVPPGTATATFSSPGTGHTFTLGAGKVLADNTFELNGALEYSMAKGDGVAPAIPATFKSSGYAAHLSGTYNF